MKVHTYPNGHTTMLTLLVHPGTDSQRAVRVVREDRPASQEAAIRKARAEHPGQPLAWLNQATMKFTPIKE